MRFCHCNVVACAVLAVLVLGVKAPAAQAFMLLEIDGIEGNATTPGYEGAIKVDSFNIAQARHAVGGSPLSTLAPLTIIKVADNASSGLVDATLEGPKGGLLNWKLTILDSGPQAQASLTLELCQVYISNFHFSASAGGGLSEGVEFTYGGFRLGTPVRDAGGQNTGEYIYNQLEGAICTVGGPPPPTDTDGDGLSDAQEAALGTNPNSVDTDGDGLVDGAGGIVSVAAYPAGIDTDGDGFVDGESDYGTDPTLADTDDDGFTDGEEVAAGSNPLDHTSPFLAGDLNNDGLVDMADVLLAERLLRRELDLTQGYLERGDVAPVIEGELLRDGVFNIGDLLIIQSKVLAP